MRLHQPLGALACSLVCLSATAQTNPGAYPLHPGGELIDRLELGQLQSKSLNQVFIWDDAQCVYQYQARCLPSNQNTRNCMSAQMSNCKPSMFDLKQARSDIAATAAEAGSLAQTVRQQAELLDDYVKVVGVLKEKNERLQQAVDRLTRQFEEARAAGSLAVRPAP